MRDTIKTRLLWTLCLAGALAAALSGLAERAAWLDALCGFVSGACRETAAYAIFGLPVWIAGLIFYAALAVCLLRLPRLLSPLVALGAGFEVALVAILILKKLPCPFCLVNLAVVALLFWLTLDKASLWRTLALIQASFLLAALSPDLNPAAIPGESSGKEPLLAATVGGEPVTMTELDAGLAVEIHNLDMDVYRLRRDKLNELIVNALLRTEAKKQGTSVRDLVQKEVIAKLSPVSDEEVGRFYDQNRARYSQWTGTEDELKERMRAYLRNREESRAILAYAHELESRIPTRILLETPNARDRALDLSANPTAGPADAPVTVVEFSDYECPACRRGHEAARMAREMYKDRVRWAFKDLPLDMHKHARGAAEAARCVAEQDKFWEYQDVLYASPEDLTPERLRQLAEEVGADLARFDACLASGVTKTLVQKDVEDARRLGLDGTPAFVINGRVSSGAQSLEQFQEAIEAELRSAETSMGGPAAAQP